MQIVRNIGLVLEGGGMRGVFTSGVLDAFMKHSLYFGYVVAVSAGACNGMSYISRQPRRARFSNIDMLVTILISPTLSPKGASSTLYCSTTASPMRLFLMTMMRFSIILGVLRWSPPTVSRVGQSISLQRRTTVSRRST